MFKDKKQLWQAVKDFSLILLGTAVQAVGLRLFLVPANLVRGGLSGISQIINYYTEWPIGLMIFIGNIPLFLLGWRFLGGPRFVSRTVFAVVTFSFFVDLIPNIPFFPLDGLTDDILLNSLYGAIVSGFGYGLVYRARGTSGGSDILARILNHWRGVSMTQSYMIVDSAVILGAGLAFGWQPALYALITLYVSGIVAENTLAGSGTIRTALIITSQPEVVSREILSVMARGVTVLSGTGAYTGTSKPVLYCVVTRSEVAQLKMLVQECDPQAFMVIGQAHEALGEGFQPLEKQ
jgi:uncharacterized membrane-anchored protein YitT (DUF2179 family)